MKDHTFLEQKLQAKQQNMKLQRGIQPKPGLVGQLNRRHK